MKKIFVLSFLLTSMFAHAHEGPAFPVLINKETKDYTVSVWADPDTGNGTYNLYFRPVSDVITDITTQSYPLSDRNRKISGVAKKLADSSDQQNYVAVVPFDTEEKWETKFIVKQKDGKEELVFVQVDVTPSGPSKWEFALYFLPFLMIGFVWGKAFLRRKR